jgi:hypothetical protein
MPGIVARASADSRLKSAFLNTLFFDYAAGRDLTLPVSPDGTTWLLSVTACARAVTCRIVVAQVAKETASNHPARSESQSASAA